MASPALEPPSDALKAAHRIVRCGTFEVDLDSGELRKAGALVRLRQQAFTVLALLVSEPGRVFTREDLRQRVWGDETFVDFDQGLNSCVKEIRAALADSAEAPVYVETLPKRGYRWIGPAELLAPSPAPAVPPPPPGRQIHPAVVGLAVLAALAVGLAIGLAGREDAPEARWRRVTFQRGWIDTARFVPGGGLVYGADWGEGSIALYQASDGSPDARRLPLADVRLQAVSPRGELALTRSPGAGLLSRVPLAGGPAKELLDRVIAADFGRDDTEMAAVHLVSGEGARVEFPVGHVVALANAPEVRVSPDGQLVAFVDYRSTETIAASSPSPIARVGGARSVRSGEASTAWPGPRAATRSGSRRPTTAPTPCARCRSAVGCAPWSPRRAGCGCATSRRTAACSSSARPAASSRPSSTRPAPATCRGSTPRS